MNWGVLELTTQTSNYEPFLESYTFTKQNPLTVETKSTQNPSISHEFYTPMRPVTTVLLNLRGVKILPLWLSS